MWRLGHGATASSNTMMIPEATAFADQIATHAEPFDRLGKLIDRTITAASHIDQNISVALSLDALLDDLAGLSRLA